MRWLVERGAARGHTYICLEATGPYSETVAAAPDQEHWCMSVINPAGIKGFAQDEFARNQTDRIDAGLLPTFFSLPILDIACQRLAQGRGWVMIEA